MKRIAPGVYDDGRTLHLDLSELLTAYGYADTPENRAVIEQVARDRFAAMDIPVTTTDEPL